MFFTDLMALAGSMSTGRRHHHSAMSLTTFESHLSETITWLLNSIRFSKDGSGSAQSYRLFRGWSKSFPETTGYIIPTLFDYSKLTRLENAELRSTATNLGRWLILIQLENGACMSGLYTSHPKPSLFNTGQNLLGYVRLYEETKEDDFILSCQDDTGAYVRHTYNDIAACYNVRTAWATLKLGLELKNEKYIEGALRNVRWTLGKQQPNGWFSSNSFSVKKNPNTHSIAYVLEGLIESYALVPDEQVLSAVVKTAGGILSRYESRGWISGEHDGNFDYLGSYTCITGNIQMAGVWLKLYSILNDPRYLEAATGMISGYLHYHDITTKNPGLRGGVHGSLPHWGRYAPLKYPNWAAKFLCDTLMQLIVLLKASTFRQKDSSTGPSVE
jgi:hypothetical protein